MTNVLTSEEADAIVPKEARKRASAKERLQQRENDALEELARLGFRVTWHQMPQRVSADVLRGVEAGMKPGGCYAVAYNPDGRRKSISGNSAVGALDQARSWFDWNAKLKDDAAAKFTIVPIDEPVPPEVRVRSQSAGDTRTTQLRRQSTERRVVSLEGTPHLVDAHGDPAN